MIPYICALLFLALPIGWAEWAMAHYGGEKGFHSGPAIVGMVGFLAYTVGFGGSMIWFGSSAGWH